jgi:hypothetical protein
MGAPLTVIQSIVDADASQLSVTNRVRGTVLHEVLGQGVSLMTTKYLLQACKDNSYGGILAKTDELGRTILHCIVLHAIKALHCPGTTWTVFRELVMSHPAAVRSADCDGNTPLLLLLLHQDTYRQNSMSEAHIFRMVKLMVSVCPEAATLCRKVQRHWPTQNAEDGTVGDGVPTPLTYGMLYGRSEETIGLLLDASCRAGSDPCMTLVSSYHEVPLHMAVSLRSSVSLLKRLVEQGPEAMLVSDIHNLTPLDWLWIRHTLDWTSSTPMNPVSPSTRRYLQNNFSELHNQASREEKTQVSTVLQETLWQRMRLLLSATAIAACNEPVYKRGEPWSMIHAACFVQCPLAMVRLALRRQGTQLLQQRDLRMGRLPLHYAASRKGYAVRIPVGAMSEGVQDIAEPSAVLELLDHFPEAARVADTNGQLPLHVAIDTAASTDGSSNWNVIQALLSQYPASLDRRDGKSKLFPFMQAAIGRRASVEDTFLLLLENPTLVGSAI